MSANFSLNFLDDHAGTIIKDSATAIIEIIANSYDAGATEIRLLWPDEVNGTYEFKDNGIGLTDEQFDNIWMQLSFNRIEVFGSDARVPEKAKDVVINRRAFGKNGKGRHAPFCFSRSFCLNSRAESGNKEISKRISRSNSVTEPFSSKNVTKAEKKLNSHGTVLHGIVENNFLAIESLKDLISSKFLVDPSFKIFINDDLVSLQDIEGLTTFEVDITEKVKIKIHFFNSVQNEQKIRFKGAAWWVNNRLVSEPSWTNILTKESYIDGRFDTAKKTAFIIQADHLEHEVLADWSGFKTSEVTKQTVSAADKFIRDKILELTSSDRLEKKQTALTENVDKIRDLSVISQVNVVKFVDEAIVSCKRLSQDDLNSLVQIIVNLEKTKSGFNLVTELSKCSPDDLEKWNEIISKWSASTAHLVLDEISKRLLLIEKLKELIVTPGTKELQEMQPVFDNGLWIFGPEYEGILDFYSNKSLKTIVEEEFGGEKAPLESPRKRPDFVASVYSSDQVNHQTGLVTEISKILIIELKTTGIPIKDAEINQGKQYAKALKKSGQMITDSTRIDVFVLGTEIDSMARAEDVPDLKIRIFPCTYNGIVQQAHARLLYLQRKIEKLGFEMPKRDSVLEKALSKGTQLELNQNED